MLSHKVLQGSIPYVPFLRAPYYIWIGRVPQLATIMAETKAEAPSGFPATFLYTMSWEDPRPDMEVSYTNFRFNCPNHLCLVLVVLVAHSCQILPIMLGPIIFTTHDASHDTLLFQGATHCFCSSLCLQAGNSNGLTAIQVGEEYWIEMSCW